MGKLLVEKLGVEFIDWNLLKEMRISDILRVNVPEEILAGCRAGREGGTPGVVVETGTLAGSIGSTGFPKYTGFVGAGTVEDGPAADKEGGAPVVSSTRRIFLIRKPKNWRAAGGRGGKRWGGCGGAGARSTRTTASPAKSCAGRCRHRWQ
uniref:Uncharacterized protein n=1 Tax=Amphimedon queenslandica TaxID=400682 RepID=A0A1X7TUN7_AMPQE